MRRPAIQQAWGRGRRPVRAAPRVVVAAASPVGGRLAAQEPAAFGLRGGATATEPMTADSVASLVALASRAVTPRRRCEPPCCCCQWRAGRVVVLHVTSVSPLQMGGMNPRFG